MKNLKITANGNNYWNGTGAYEKELKVLTDELVPIMGQAKTINGELIRAIHRLCYDYYNNDNCNARVSYKKIDWMYANFLILIKDKLYEILPKRETISLISKIKTTILKGKQGYSNGSYNLICDYVIFYVLNHTDEQLPEKYKDKIY